MTVSKHAIARLQRITPFLLVFLIVAGCREGAPSSRRQTPPSAHLGPVPTASASSWPSLHNEEPLPIPTLSPKEEGWDRAGIAVRRFYLTTRDARRLLMLEAMLPSPCHRVRYQVHEQGSQLRVSLYTVLAPEDQGCVEILSYFWGYIDLTPWLSKRPKAQVWLGEQPVPEQEGLAPPATRVPVLPLPPTRPPETPQGPKPSPPTGEAAMEPIPSLTSQEFERPTAPFYLDSVRLTHEGPAWRVVVTGSLPTPCHQPRHRTVPQAGKLMVEIFTLAPEGPCIQVLQPFQGYVDLTPWAAQVPGIEVWVNGRFVGPLGTTEE